MQKIKTVGQAKERLEKKGYAEQFELHFDALIDPRDERLYHSTDFEIEATYRFDEEDEDNTFVLAIRTHDDRKGVLVDGYGNNSDPISIEMLEKFQLQNRSRKP